MSVLAVDLQSCVNRNAFSPFQMLIIVAFVSVCGFGNSKEVLSR